MEMNLEQYLRNVVSLEKACYTQEQMLRQIKADISRLGVRREFTKPIKKPHSVDGFIDHAIGYGMMGIVAGVVILIVTGYLLFVCVLFALYGAIFARSKEVSNAVQEAEEDYQNRLAIYNNNIANDAQRVKNELVQRDRLVEVHDMLFDKHMETLDILKQYYELNVIHPQYRGLVPICSIYDYIASGRCTTLGGYEGAYNKYDNEVVHRTIISKLDEALNKLDQISVNQTTLYSAIRASNHSMQSLIQQTQQQTKLLKYTAENSAIAAFNAEQTTIEANQIKWLTSYTAFK